MLASNLITFSVFFYRTSYAEIDGVRYSKGSVVVLSTKEVLPTFGHIIDIILTDVDVCTFVCEVLHSEGFVEHFHAYEVTCPKPIPIVFCKKNDLSDYHVLSICKQHQSMYVVQKYHLV